MEGGIVIVLLRIPPQPSVSSDREEDNEVTLDVKQHFYVSSFRL